MITTIQPAYFAGKLLIKGRAFFVLGLRNIFYPLTTGDSAGTFIIIITRSSDRFMADVLSGEVF